jgi:c-di-GMP-binding flagellar brake protein YcgR
MPADAAIETLTEITDQVTNFALSSKDLNGMEQAQLLDILMCVASVTKGVRRSPRKRVSIPLKLHYQVLDQNWTEETTTLEVSSRGASIECPIPIPVGELVAVQRLDTSRQARGKVKWLRRNADGSHVLGIEFMDCEDFWGFKL